VAKTESIERWAGFRNGKLQGAQDHPLKPFRACIYKSKRDALDEHDDVRKVTITWEKSSGA